MAGLKCKIINLKSEVVQVNETCLVINRDSGKFLKISDKFETGVERCVRSHLSSVLSVFLASPVLAFPKTVYGAHFYVSMKCRAILGPPLGPHKLSNIYASPLEVVWWRTVEPL